MPQEEEPDLVDQVLQEDLARHEEALLVEAEPLEEELAHLEEVVAEAMEEMLGQERVIHISKEVFLDLEKLLYLFLIDDIIFQNCIEAL